MCQSTMSTMCPSSISDGWKGWSSAAQVPDPKLRTGKLSASSGLCTLSTKKGCSPTDQNLRNYPTSGVCLELHFSWQCNVFQFLGDVLDITSTSLFLTMKMGRRGKKRRRINEWERRGKEKKLKKERRFKEEKRRGRRRKGEEGGESREGGEGGGRKAALCPSERARQLCPSLPPFIGCSVISGHK